MCTVIHDLARTCHGTCLKEIYSKTVASVDAVLCAHSVAVKVLDAAFCYVVLRKSCHELSIETVVC